MNIDKSLFKEYGEDFIKILTRELVKAGKRNSGNLINSLDYKIKPLGQEILIEIEALDYLTYIDEGRKKGSFPPISAIKKWARIKGLDENLAYPISKNIYKYGIKPTNVIDKAIRKFENSFEISDDIIDDIENKIVDKINKINK